MKQLSTLIILLFVLTITNAQSTTDKLLIQNVHVIPLHIHSILENKDVVIQNGEITHIRTHNPNDTTQYTLGRINAEGKFLISGFADAHVHLPKKENLETFFLMNLMNGVTSLRSMRGEEWHLEIDQKAPLCPKLFLSAPPISHKDSLTPKTADQLVKNYQASGYDFIKILSVKDAKTFDYLAGAATKYNIPLAGHAPRNTTIFNISNSKVYQSIEHLGGFFTLRDMPSINTAVDQTIRAGTFHSPTLDWYYTRQVLEDDLRKREGSQYMPKPIIKEWEDNIAKHYAESTPEEREKERASSKQRFDTRLLYLEFIYRQGGLLVLSPDATGTYNIPGFGVHTEMQHYTNAKISNYDILKAASFNYAKMLKKDSYAGTIKIGSPADLVLLNSNPIEDIKNTTDIEGIVFKGQYYSQDTLRDKLKSLQK